MIDGVMRAGPSQLNPWKGSANVFEEIATWYSPSSTRSKAKVPSSPVVAESTLSPSALRRSTVTSASPTSSLSTSPGVPPPGLKSLQTTPVIPPCSASGSTASTASSGMSVARTAVSPSSATSPGSSGSSSVKPLSVDPVRSSVDGRAVVNAPVSLTISWKPTIAALIAPRSGSSWYMIRQMIPTANSETASGMKMATLKADAQRTRSARTARTSPTAVTPKGITSTQRTLFLIAVWTRSSLNMRS